MGGTLRVDGAARRWCGLHVWFICPGSTAGFDGSSLARCGGLRVYVADDDRLSRRELLMALLTERIGVAGSGPANRSCCDTLRAADASGRLPAVVLVGHVLESEGELDIAARIGGDVRLARVPLVLAPISGLRGHARAVREAGYSAYLPRPFRRGELNQCVRAVLRSSGCLQRRSWTSRARR